MKTSYSEGEYRNKFNSDNQLFQAATAAFEKTKQQFGNMGNSVDVSQFNSMPSSLAYNNMQGWLQAEAQSQSHVGIDNIDAARRCAEDTLFWAENENNQPRKPIKRWSLKR